MKRAVSEYVERVKERVKDGRQKRRWTIRFVASQLNCHSRTISRAMEHCKLPPAEDQNHLLTDSEVRTLAEHFVNKGQKHHRDNVPKLLDVIDKSTTS